MPSKECFELFKRMSPDLHKILSEKSYLEVVDSPGHMQCINYDANNTICVIGISKESASCEEVFNKHYQAVQATIANRMKFN